MGCHAGLNVADSVVTAGTSVSTIDWPQAYAQKGVGAYLGNTGFGYGDSHGRLLRRGEPLFARRIAAGSAVGDALVGAKQEYFGGRGVFGVYDEKAMAEFTLYGLPMWSVSGPPGMAAPTSAAAPADTGTVALSRRVRPAATAAGGRRDDHGPVDRARGRDVRRRSDREHGAHAAGRGRQVLGGPGRRAGLAPAAAPAEDVRPADRDDRARRTAHGADARAT